MRDLEIVMQNERNSYIFRVNRSSGIFSLVFPFYKSNLRMQSRAGAEATVDSVRSPECVHV